jgi:hypothetical protein
MDQITRYTEPHVSVTVVVDRFATEPVAAVQVADEQLSEEELHTLFEQAMSDRLFALGARLSRSSESLTTPSEMADQKARATSSESFTSTMPLKLRAGTLWTLMNHGWQRALTQVSQALMLVMIGFDLMGLLVLHMH